MCASSRHSFSAGYFAALDAAPLLTAIEGPCGGAARQMWGEHMHHGYYEVGKPVKNHQEAQVSNPN